MKKVLVLAMVLALVAIIVAPMAAFAATDDNTVINGTIGAVTAITAPSDFSVTPMTVAGPNAGVAGTDGSVTCNSVFGYQVTVASNNANGKMVGSATTKELVNALLVTTGADASKLTDVVVKDSPAQICVSTIAAGVTAIPLSAKQTVVVADAADTYSITLTYTATAKTS